eukprot:CAMPEP_0180470762 /NCGR_PEP_ID=MMETSP1036_2-20121128/28757_1 /TAXON_ID=632150 /ORGANISM="Azadinium spinosum, Strain 3D9" /LENGTH=130 /DNA_ID=CAMNT_0022477915 /DNA_START=29 /DNA_END=421 /DNA_ORIENTATION=+
MAVLDVVKALPHQILGALPHLVQAPLKVLHDRPQAFGMLQLCITEARLEVQSALQRLLLRLAIPLGEAADPLAQSVNPIHHGGTSRCIGGSGDLEHVALIGDQAAKRNPEFFQQRGVPFSSLAGIVLEAV